MSLRILVTADPELPVPPREYGGIERVIALLVDGLVERGHDVTLLAHAESSTHATQLAWCGQSSASMVDTVRHASQLTTAVRSLRPDLVQSFSRLAYLTPVLPSPVRKVMSYQRPITPRGVRWATRLAGDSLSFTGCSADLVTPIAAHGRWRVIHNAVPVDRLPFARDVEADAPLMFLGRMEAIKGPHLAIEVARRSGRRLLLAGNVPDAPEHRAYFDAAVAPHLDSDRVVYVGPVDDRTKGEYLARAAALLMPVQWDEPFGIVMAEALACGTPVIGLDRGAVREVVETEVTGMVCRDIDAMVAAVGRISTIDRVACRRAAVTRFSPATLVEAYLSLYADCLAGLGGPPKRNRGLQSR